jgi:hypothetical protein
MRKEKIMKKDEGKIWIRNWDDYSIFYLFVSFTLYFFIKLHWYFITFSFRSNSIAIIFWSWGSWTDKIIFSSVILKRVNVHKVCGRRMIYWNFPLVYLVKSLYQSSIKILTLLLTCWLTYCCNARTASWTPRFVCGLNNASSVEL